MSLQLIAKQMEAKGRKGDSMLVHMTPDEVAGLQKLAESAGGSLSVNPDTGLVEANFLKRMLPTLVGAGVGFATMNPYLGAAAGAAVGGAQAKQNDQDFLTGAALGGLSGFGAGSLGSGIAAAGSQAAQAGAMQTALADQAAQQTAQQAIQNTAAQQAIQNAGQAEAANMLTLGSDPATQAAFNLQQQELGAAAINQAAEKAGTDFAAQGISDQAGQGISALVDRGSNVGRDALMAEVGGKAGLATDIGMAAAYPMMAPGEAPGEEPVDDEMYSYEYNPGRTYAERTPSGSSAEREYFRGNYSPVRKIRANQYGAAKGGLMSLAEGGSTAAPSQGMTGGSAAAFDYLMGAAPSSAGLSSIAMQAPATQAPMADSGRAYIFNPTAGTFARNPNFVDPEVAAQAAKDAAAAADAAAELERQRNSGGGNAAGGLLGLAKGGMKSGGFVIPADVVAMVGEGNTDAGYSRIKSIIPGATAIKGKDGGQADTVKTSIEGKQPARVAHGEMYIPPETVKRMGGAKKLYAMMDRVRQQATGSKKQIKPVSLKKALA